MADHSKPTVTSTYANYTSELDGRLDDLALGLDPATTTPTNVPTNAIRWASASNKWQKWNGTAWGDLSSSYSININGTVGATTPAAGSFTSITNTGGTANGVTYLNGSKVVTSGSALTFDGTNFTVVNNASANSITLSRTSATARDYALGVDGDGGFRLTDSTGGVVVLSSQPSIAFLASAGDLYFKASNAEAMRLTSTGLGIGTSSPSYKLHVAGQNAALTNSGSTAITYFDVANAYGTTRIGTDASGNGYVGTASNIPLALYAGNAIRATIDTSGNLGLGVTPSAWASGRKAIQVGTRGALSQNLSGGILVSNNWFNDGANKYIVNGYSQLYLQADTGNHEWYTAPSGTAGNAISFTQAMTLDASGNLAVGTTTPFGTTANRTVLSVNGTTDVSLNVGSGGTQRAYLYGSSSVGQLGTIGALPLVFATNDTERMRIDSSGNLLVAITNVDPVLNRTNGAAVLSDGSIRSRSNNIWSVGIATTSGDNIQFWTDNGSARVAAGRISSSGSTTSYNTSSDYRLKNTIVPMTGALAKVGLLKPVTYKWNADGSDGEGFIAHELAEVCPQAVTGEKDAVDADGNPVYQGIDTSFLVATLTAAIQEQQAIIESLKARLDAANL